MNAKERTCIHCGRKIVGRVDKKFCDDYCRNSYNNLKNSDATNFVRNINYTLRKNRRILEGFVPEGEQIKKVPKDELVRAGLNFKYFTHTVKNKNNQQYIFVYDYGYLHLSEEIILVVKSKNYNEGN